MHAKKWHGQLLCLAQQQTGKGAESTADQGGGEADQNGTWGGDGA